MSEKIVRIINKQKDPSSLSWDLKQALEGVCAEIEDGKFPKVGLIIGVDDKNGCFITNWCQAGLTCSKSIAALELVKAEMISLLLEDKS